MSELASKTCVPCRGDVPAIKGKHLEQLLQLVPQWKVVNDHHIVRAFKFPDFSQALDFVNRVGELAEQQGHHPDILLAWGKRKSHCGRTRLTGCPRATSSWRRRLIC